MFQLNKYFNIIFESLDHFPIEITWEGQPPVLNENDRSEEDLPINKNSLNSSQIKFSMTHHKPIRVGESDTDNP